MILTIIDTDEGLKLVPDDLRRASGVGASQFVTVTRVTLPAARTHSHRSRPRRGSRRWKTAFDYRIVHILVLDGVLNAIASMSVLIYEFALLLPIATTNWHGLHRWSS